EAEALATLIERHGYSHQALAELLGKSRPYVSNTLALTRLPEPVKADLQREGRGVSRELLLGVARQEDPEAALTLWRRLQLDLLSVRQFRAEKSGTTSERTAGMEVLAAALPPHPDPGPAPPRTPPPGHEPPPAAAPRLPRPLRRPARLVQRQLASSETRPPS